MFFIAALERVIVFSVEIATPHDIFNNHQFRRFDHIWYSLCYNLGWSSFYAFILLRVRYTFQGSIYALKASFLYIHSIICIFAPVLVIVAIFSVLAFEICSTIWIVITFIGSCHLIYLFNHNLYQLVLSRSDHQEDKLDAVESSEGG